MLAWPAQRFETFYAAFVKRLTVEEIAERKLVIIGGLWANSNYDGKDVDRMEIIKKVEEAHDQAALQLKYGVQQEKDAESEFGEFDRNNPFFGKVPVPPELDVAKDAPSPDWYKEVDVDQD